jgi:predicted small metal-binding protein
MKRLSCREAGFDCDHVMEGKTDEEVLLKAREHGSKQHGLPSMTEEQERDIRRMIKNV